MNKLLAMTSAVLLGAVLASPTAQAQWSGIEGKPDNSRERGNNEQPEDSRARDEGRSDSRPAEQSAQASQQTYQGANQTGGGRGGRDDNQYGSGRGGRDDNQRGSGRGDRDDNRYGNGRGGLDDNTYRGGRSGRDNHWDDNRHGGRDDNRWDDNRHGNRGNNHWDDNRHGGRNDHRYSRYYSPHRYRSSISYVQPRGYYYNRWDIGARLPYGYYGRSYYIDYRPYGLAPPPYGYQWVRVDRDVYLVAISTGLVRDILYDLFY